MLQMFYSILTHMCIMTAILNVFANVMTIMHFCSQAFNMMRDKSNLHQIPESPSGQEPARWLQVTEIHQNNLHLEDCSDGKSRECFWN